MGPLTKHRRRQLRGAVIDSISSVRLMLSHVAHKRLHWSISDIATCQWLYFERRDPLLVVWHTVRQSLD